MAVFKTIITYSDFLDEEDLGEAIINTDKVTLAMADDEGNTILIMEAHKSPFIKIDMPYDVYAAIVCAGQEHITTAAAIAR